MGKPTKAQREGRKTYLTQYFWVSKPLLWNGKMWIITPARGDTYIGGRRYVKTRDWHKKQVRQRMRRALKKARTTGGKPHMTVA